MSLKLILLILIIITGADWAISQTQTPESLQQQLAQQPDILKIKTLITIASDYEDKEKYDTALTYYLNALKLAEEIQNQESLFQSLNAVARFYEHRHKRDLALEFALRAQKVAAEQNNKEHLFNIKDLIGGFIYFNDGKYDESLKYGIDLYAIAMEMNDKQKIAYAQMYLGDIYRVLNKFDTAIEIYSKALNTWKELRDTNMIRTSTNNIGVIYDAQKKPGKALSYYLEALKIAEMQGYCLITADYAKTVAWQYFEINKTDSALFYANRSRNLYVQCGNKREQAKIYDLLSGIYSAKADYRNAYSYLHKYKQIRDSLDFSETQNNMDSLQTKYTSEKTEKEMDYLKKEADLQSKVRNMFIAASVLLVIIAFLIANKYRLKKRAEETLNVKNAALTKTLDELNSAQAQLIQSEKMASLGELTAGIAHEIQNPLNFVNNFSDINTELLTELKEEIDNGNYDDAKSIAKDVIENEQKINHHGKRADAIVKGMLQHSRQTTGTKEPTDINALCEEYLRLAYHGLRAKDKNFNADFKTDFDDIIGKINIIPQDFGRVLLNLYNNAFYATNEKKKTAGENYKPLVSISTKKIGDKVKIKVADNGNGISQNLVDKIFQPFFTTKPTGQGTGLGLSLSYDIIKAHGGEIKVETKEDEGTEFIIQLPV
ncbi:hypothetical protein BH10BAC2_BH10BAC2_39160 [soil metagenome]